MKLKNIALFFLLLFVHFELAFCQINTVINSGHCSFTIHLAMSNNGKYLASTSYDKTIKLWEIKSGREVKTFEGHTNKVICVAYSPDDRYLLSGGQDKLLILWDIETGKEIKRLNDHRQWINAVTFSPDNKYFYSAAYGGEFKKWDFEYDAPIYTTEPHPKEIYDMNYNPDGKSIATSGRDNSIKFLNPETGQEIKIFNGHTDYVNSFDFNADGSKMVSGANNWKADDVFIWDTKTTKTLVKIEAHKRGVNCVAFNPNGDKIASAGNDSTIKIWDAEKGKLQLTIQDFSREITDLIFSKDGDKLFSCGYDYVVKVWDVNTGALIRTIGENISVARELCVNQSSIVAGFSDGSVRILNFENNKNHRFLKNNDVAVYTFDISKDNSFLLKAGLSNEIDMWDLKNYKLVKTFDSKEEKIYSLDISPDNQYFVLGGTQSVELWNIDKRKIAKEVISDIKQVNCVAYSPTGKYFASVGNNKIVYIWNSQGNEYKELTNHSWNIYTAQFSSDGKMLATGAGDKTIRIWDVEKGKEIKNLTQDKSRAYYCLKFSDDDKLILAGRYDGVIELWDVNSNKILRTFDGHLKSVNAVDFLNSGEFIISASNDKTIKLWETKSGDLLATLYFIANSDDYLVYTPQGYFDGTQKGTELIHYVKGMNIIPLTAFYEKYHIPNLLANLINGNKYEEKNVSDIDIQLPPVVEIISPEKNSEIKTPEITVSIKVVDKGGGIDELRLYHNGKLVKTTQRGFKFLERSETLDFNIIPVSGENKLKAIAFNNNRIESEPSEIKFNYSQPERTAALYFLVVGIDIYKRTDYNLNYALTDANAFKYAIETGGKDIYTSINTVFLKDEEFTKEKLTDVFTNLEQTTKPEDVFVFYYAGHGVMSEEDEPEFHIVPYDVTQLYGDNEMLQSKAVSATELKTFSTKLKAQKQLFVFDACQSGGMTDLLASRSQAAERAIAQLARSTGTYWLAASNSHQLATEFDELGHGLFTYTLLKGLNGDADSGEKDQKITIEELAAYINDKVPEYSEKYKGSPQYPTSYGYGQDFPIIIIK